MSQKVRETVAVVVVARIFYVRYGKIKIIEDDEIASDESGWIFIAIVAQKFTAMWLTFSLTFTIKEFISAVEANCKLLTGDEHATLGTAIIN